MNLALTLYQRIGIIIGFSAIFLVISSNLIVNHEQTLLAKPGKDNPGKGQGKSNKGNDGGDGKRDEPRKEPKAEPRKEPKAEQKDDNIEEQVKTNIYKGFSFDSIGDNNSKGFNFAAVGDFGCSKNTKKTIDNIKDNKPELVLPLGDLSYQISGNCWFDIMSPFKKKVMITLGFHDVNDGQAKMDQYFKSFELDKPYYSFDYGKVHFIVMASESSFQQGSPQYKFINEDLKKASEDKNVDWVIVTSYGPFYTSPSIHKAEKPIRDLYHPLFEKYDVDLVLQAHNHNYQRTYPISYNPGDSSKPTVTNQSTTGYKDHHGGTVFALVGTGGESFYPLTGQAPYVATQFDKFGFLNIDISNGNPHTKLTGTFYDNKGSIVKDQFTIEKEIKSKNKTD